MTIDLNNKILPVYKEHYNNMYSNPVYNVFVGGRASGKSTYISQYIILYMLKSWFKYHIPVNTLVIRAFASTHKQSTRATIIRIIHEFGLDSYFKIPKSELTITFIPANTCIFFRGTDDPEKTASISPTNGFLSLCWFEECSQIKEIEFNKIDLSVRGQYQYPVKKQMIISMNPWRKSHFVNKQFMLTNRIDTFKLTTTYKDNPFLSKEDLCIFDSMRINSPKRYEIEGLGKFISEEGLVVTNYEISNNKPQGCSYHIVGIDFGYIDETAIVSVFVDKKNYIIYVDDYYQQSQMSNKAIANKLIEMNLQSSLIYADSEDPRTINELRILGIRGITPVSKGANSVIQGIRKLQDYHIIIKSNLTDLITDVENYAFEEDTKTGNLKEKTSHEFSHGIDALRYCISELNTRYMFTSDKMLF